MTFRKPFINYFSLFLRSFISDDSCSSNNKRSHHSLLSLLVFTTITLSSVFFNESAQACGTLQTCNEVSIQDVRTVPETELFMDSEAVKYTPGQNTVQFEMDVRELANWYYSVPTMMFPAIVIAEIGDRSLVGTVSSYSATTPYYYGYWYSGWYGYIQTANWTFNIEWDGNDQAGQLITSPQIAKITVYAGAESVYTSRLMLPETSSKKELGQPDCEKSVGDPCNAVTGNTYKNELDYVNGDSTLRFERHYNSLEQEDVGLGTGWTSNLYRRLTFNDNTITITQTDGRSEVFQFNGSQWTGDSDSQLQLLQSADEFTLIRIDGSQETYSLSGKLLTESDRNGNASVYSYDVDDFLQSVTTPSGHQLRLEYDIDGHLIKVIDPKNNEYAYHYDTDNNLIQVDFPDTSTLQYEYQTNSSLLTGIIDGKGVHFVTYVYDSENRAIQTAFPQTSNAVAQERFEIEHDEANQQAIVTDASGYKNTLIYEENLGVKNVVSSDHSADNKGFTQTFDANNNLLRRTDEQGIITTFTYNEDNQLISLTEAAGSPLERTTTYEYVSNAIDFPVKTSKESVFTGEQTETQIIRDSHHNPVQIIQSGFTPEGNPIQRSIGLKYNSHGQITEIDGSRIDTSDLTLLGYYSCTTGAQCGQLYELKNALGHTTRYDSYDADGRVIQMTDSNGLVKSYT